MPRSAKSRVTNVEPLMLNAEETAVRMGVSQTELYRLREEHSFYENDIEAPTRSETKAGQPRWSDEKIRFILFAWRKTPQGTRQYDDDTAHKMWLKMQAQQDKEYRKKAGY